MFSFISSDAQQLVSIYLLCYVRLSTRWSCCSARHLVSICVELNLDNIHFNYLNWRTHLLFYSILFHTWSCSKLSSIQLNLFCSELCFQKFEWINIKLNFIDFLYRFSLVMLYLVKPKKVAEHIKEFFAMKSLNKGFSTSLCNVSLISHWSMLWLIIE